MSIEATIKKVTLARQDCQAKLYAENHFYLTEHCLSSPTGKCQGGELNYPRLDDSLTRLVNLL